MIEESVYTPKFDHCYYIEEDLFIGDATSVNFDASRKRKDRYVDIFIPFVGRYKSWDF